MMEVKARTTLITKNFRILNFFKGILENVHGGCSKFGINQCQLQLKFGINQCQLQLKNKTNYSYLRGYYFLRGH